MPKLVLTNCRLFAGGADLSGDTNEATITAKRDDKDVTTYGSGGWKEHIAGLGQAALNAKGFWEAGNLGLVDDQAFAQAGLAGGFTVCPQGAADQAICYVTNAVEFDYQLFGKVGDVAPYTVMATSTWPLVRGVVAVPPGTALTANGTGTINQLGAVAAGQQIYADLHVISVAGTTPSITFTVQSAAAVGFASPTTRLTFNPFTGIGGQILRTPGPITDQFWRAQWAVSGTAPSFLAAMSFGIA